MPSSSLQESAGGAKSTKFVGTQNLLDPMMRPFQQQHDDDDEDDTDDPHKILADSVNERLSNAVHELQMKHERGRNERDHPDRAPTGSAYQHHHPQQILQQTQQQQQTRMTVTPDSKLQQQQKSKNNDDDDYDWLLDEQDNDNNNDSDGGDDDDDSDDHRVLRDLRERRLAELRARAQARAANLARGHGQVRTISQDEFLPETTTATATTGTSNSNSSSEWVVCHFFHREFERCAVMDHHLQTAVAPAHPECKFLRLEAARAPFFVAKLRIRVLPTLLVLRNGRVVDRLTGFEGLSSGASGCKTPPLPPQRHFAARPSVDPDAWETSALQAWLAQTGAIRYDPPADEAEREEEPEIRRQRLRGCIRRGDAAAADGYHEDDY